MATIRRTIQGYPFVLARLREAVFPDVAGVYLVVSVDADGSWYALDVGESGQLGSRLEKHDRCGCWMRNSSTGNIWVGVHFMPTDQYDWDDRRVVERVLRGQLRPMCGDR